MPMLNKPLHGITVLDFSTRLPGPLASLMLAEAGARVIKLERPPEGDETRHFAPSLEGQPAHFLWLNRGKESVALDLKQPADRALLDELIAEADILIEQFRPGVMARLGLGYADLAQRHPALIYCSITGYGQQDPRSMQAGHDLNYQASAGLVGGVGLGPRGVPPLPPVLLGDIAGGTYPAVISILLALRARDASGGRQQGRGQYLDIAMAGNIEVFGFWQAVQGTLGGTWPEPGQGRHTGGSPRYNIYATRDGRWLAVAALEDRFWQQFCDGIGLELPPGLEQRDPQAVIEQVATLLASRDAGDWLARLEGRDACCNLVLHPAELPNRQAGRMPHIPLPVAPQFTYGDAIRPAPALGADNPPGPGVAMVGADATP